MTENEKIPVAVVTGGTRGIGAACCRALAGAGFAVGINYRGDGARAAAMLSELGGRGFILPADMSDADQVEQMVQRIKQTAGRVDVLVNNAGTSINKTMMETTLDDFDAQRSLMRGVWHLTRRVLRLFMLRQSGGKIINISSITGHTGNPGQIPYTMEKGALDAMTRSLAREVAGRNILVNSVAPGFIDTDMTRELPEEIKTRLIGDIPLGRMGLPEEVAEVVAFLASRGSYINGSVIHVNGGIYGG
ncbi:MAG: 3-oxoacyl-ACP reductase family protein [Thermodesulfobacteriota bacterium]